MALGPAAGTLAGGAILGHWGWRASFLIFGLGSLIWLVPWLAVTERPVVRADAVRPAAGPSFRIVLTRPAAWAAGLGQFCGNFAHYFVISWLPLFLVKHQGFSVSAMAGFVSLVYLVIAVSSVLTGRLSDAAIRRGAGTSAVRKGVIGLAHLGVAVCLAICAVGDRPTILAALLFAGAFLGLNVPTLYAIGQTLAGPAAAGKWMGFQNGLANIAGIVGPIVTGVAVDATGSFAAAFWIAAAIALIGAIAWTALLPRIAPLDWRGEAVGAL